jgi:hypothetical protein
MKNICVLSVIAAVTTLMLSGCIDEQKVSLENFECLSGSIKAECIATSFNAAKGPYISEQHHQFCISEPIIDISSNEPQGNSQYRLTGSDFFSSSPDLTFSQTLVKLLLTTMQVSRQGWSFVADSPETVKLFGTEYKVLKITGPGELPGIISSQNVSWAEITLYGNIQKKVIERITVKNVLSGEKLTSYAYNWRFMEETGKQMPTKIDVLNTKNGTIDAKKVLQIHYLSFKTAGF